MKPSGWNTCSKCENYIFLPTAQTYFAIYEEPLQKFTPVIRFNDAWVFAGQKCLV